ncbi:hypothetical protein QAD02_012520 [Eretmocerus hayati]|uniref:Uncharacterized protein n=1 Tax=Eretmocerus hayati TaxID=131215 RepID=A0ACC2NZX6_9HYME|nr:hypothetical protein QAD02_012520 [Eretmocerus hayati]
MHDEAPVNLQTGERDYYAPSIGTSTHIQRDLQRLSVTPHLLSRYVTENDALSPAIPNDLAGPINTTDCHVNLSNPGPQSVTFLQSIPSSSTDENYTLGPIYTELVPTTPNRAPSMCRSSISNPSTSHLTADTSNCNLITTPSSAETVTISTTPTQLDTSRPVPDVIPSTSFLEGIFGVPPPPNNLLRPETNENTNGSLESDMDKQSGGRPAHPVPMLVELTSPMELESSNQDHDSDENEPEITGDPLAQDDLNNSEVCDAGASKRGPFNAEEIRLQQKREMNRLRQERLRKKRRKELQDKTKDKPCYLCEKLHTEHPTRWAPCTRCRKTFAERKCLAELGLKSFQCKRCMTSE